MPAHTLASRGDLAGARLLIHAQGQDEGGWSVDAFLQHLRAARLPIGLEIQDFEGHRVLLLAAAGPLVEVALAPGTYRISAEQGGARRSYTVALASGSTFELHLLPARMAP